MWKIILGAILALSSGIVTQIVMVLWNDKRAVKSLKLLLVDIIDSSNSIIDTLLSNYEKSNTVWFEFLIQLNSTRVAYDRNREWLIKISDAELRKDIVEYFDKLLIFDANARVLEGMKNGQFSQWAIDKLKGEVSKMLSNKDLGKRIKDKLKTLK